MLYNLKELAKKVEKLYTSGDFFLAFMEEKNLFPLSIKLKNPTQKTLFQNLSAVSVAVQKLEKLGVSLEYKEFDFKSVGRQKLPIAIVFRDALEFLTYLKKNEEFSNYKKAYKKAVENFASLKELFMQKPNLLLENISIVDEILAVCSFLQEQPYPNVYIRELSIEGVDTKFIQKNRAVLNMFLETILDADSYDSSVEKLSQNGFEHKYGFKFEEALVRFRILDENLYIHGMSDISLPISEFKKLKLQCENIYIVENKITTLSFMNIPNAIVIFGRGYGVGMLKNIEWMQDKNIYYWGDIDMDGLAILSQVRGYYSQTQSLMMSETEVKQLKNLAVSSADKTHKELAGLNDAESLLYERLANDFYRTNFRLEQERIPFAYVKNVISKLV